MIYEILTKKIWVKSTLNDNTQNDSSEKFTSRTTVKGCYKDDDLTQHAGPPLRWQIILIFSTLSDLNTRSYAARVGGGW